MHQPIDKPEKDNVLICLLYAPHQLTQITNYHPFRLRISKKVMSPLANHESLSSGQSPLNRASARFSGILLYRPARHCLFKESDLPHNLTRETWNSLSLSEKMSRGRRLAWDLPSGFEYNSIQNFRFSGRENDVASYTFAGKRFVLVPGGQFTIGRSPDLPWQPTPEEIDDWGYASSDLDVGAGVAQYVTEVTLPRRVVEFPAMLVEAEVEEYGWDPILAPAFDRHVSKVLAEHFSSSTEVRQVESYASDGWIRVNRDRAGKISAKRASKLSQAQVSARLKGAGFRFPTSDEWEYLCGEGSQTLYRWGDHAPLDRDPNEQASSPNSLDASDNGPATSFPPNWQEHLYPNALGVTIARNPYFFELVAEPNITRGGDGGSAICGGGGRLLAWLPLATAYFEDDFCTHDPDEPIQAGYTIGRRVLELKS